MAPSSFPLLGQVRGQDQPALDQDVGRGRGGAEFLPEGLDTAVVAHGPVAVHHHGELAGVVVARQGPGRLEVSDGLAPAAQPVADEAVELPGRGGLGDLVDEGAGDAEGLGVAVALVGTRRRGQAVGQLRSLGAADGARELLDDVGGEDLVG